MYQVTIEKFVLVDREGESQGVYYDDEDEAREAAGQTCAVEAHTYELNEIATIHAPLAWQRRKEAPPDRFCPAPTTCPVAKAARRWLGMGTPPVLLDAVEGTIPELRESPAEYAVPTKTAQAFLDRHAPAVIRFAGDIEALIGNEALTPALEAIYTDFDAVADKPGRREPLPGENVFWWCVTILEELEEMRPDAGGDPYFAMMRDQLAEMGKRLEAREDLPQQFGIHWFDELAED